MTFHVTVGVDCGLTGAVAILADGKFERFVDMPVRPTKDGKKNEVDSRQLAVEMRTVLRLHPGATFTGVVEQVNAMPSIPGVNGERRSMGAQSAFNFGCSYGMVRATLEALGFAMVLVPSSTWKSAVGLRGTQKDYSRTAASNTYPSAAKHLLRKKDTGRADALMIACWGDRSEARATIRFSPPRVVEAA